MRTVPNISPKQDQRSQQIMQKLRSLGMTWYGLKRMETRYLPHVLHVDEPLDGVVYGHTTDGYAMLIATDRRIIFLDVKPLSVNQDEVTYDVVSGLSYGHAGIWSTVTLHTKVRDYTIRTYNQHCAERFISCIEAHCLAHRKGGVHDTSAAERLLPVNRN